MKRTAFIAILLPALAFGGDGDQNSRYYFNRGAERYVGDDVEKARAWVEEGLQLYPGDGRLIALKKLLEQPPQTGGGESQENKQQQSEGDQQADPGEPDREPDADGPGAETADSRQGDPMEQAPAQMNKEEARQLLDAMREREQRDRARAAADRIRREAGLPAPVEKDW